MSPTENTARNLVVGGWVGLKRDTLLSGVNPTGKRRTPIMRLQNQLSPKLRAFFTQYGERNVFNADEMGLWYNQAPRGAIGPAALPGRNKSKERVSVLLCADEDGT